MHRYQQNWIFPEVLALAILYWAPAFIEKRSGKIQEKFKNQHELKENEYEGFKNLAESVKKENTQIEKQLRQIEHLYDVIKDAGSTLNVQEMIELTKEFTERMFDLPHFIIAVLSNDGRKYEIRIASGCEDSLFRSFEMDLESNGLAAMLARERKPVLVSSLGEQDHFLN